MGQTLSEPITAKHTTTGQDSRLLWSASSMQGWRVTMEDAHTTILNLANNALFCVFDGHGGSNVAIYAGSKLHLRLEQSEAFKQGDYKVLVFNLDGFRGNFYGH